MDSGEVRVLIVSDRRELVELVASALEGAGVCWSAVGSPSGAVALLGETAWSAVLVDVRGRRSTCGGLVDALRRARTEAKVILTDDAPFPPMCGEDGYLETLFDPAVLALMARELCRPEGHGWAPAGRPTLFGAGTRVRMRIAVRHTALVHGEVLAEDDDVLLVGADGGWPERPIPGTPVAVSLGGADGLYVFWTAVLATHNHTATLAKPAVLERVQRRVHRRREVRPPRPLTVRTPSGAVQGQVLNESAGGAMLECPVPLKPGERVALPRGTDQGTAEARVAWCAPSLGGLYRCGLAYVRGRGK